jgi:uncharacterized protein DUF2750
VIEPYEVNDEQFAAVRALRGRERFEHLLKRICDTEQVFLLADEDDQLIVLKDEHNAAPPQVPIWPHPRYVEAYRESRGGGAGYDSMELQEFVDDLLRDFAEDGVQLVVMPTEPGHVVTIAADELREAIIAYHEEWYGGWP